MGEVVNYLSRKRLKNLSKPKKERNPTCQELLAMIQKLNGEVKALKTRVFALESKGDAA